MYDEYPSLEKLEVFEFTFLSSNYKIWKNGKIVKEVRQDIKFDFTPISNSKDKIKITYNPEIEEMNSEMLFDIFIASNDRVQFYIIPNHSNANHPAINLYKDFFGPTRDTFTFNEKTPFCCSLFTIDNYIAKISFSFSNPVVLIEFEF